MCLAGNLDLQGCGANWKVWPQSNVCILPRPAFGHRCVTGNCQLLAPFGLVRWRPLPGLLVLPGLLRLWLALDGSALQWPAATAGLETLQPLGPLDCPLALPTAHCPLPTVHCPRRPFHVVHSGVPTQHTADHTLAGVVCAPCSAAAPSSFALPNVLAPASCSRCLLRPRALCLCVCVCLASCASFVSNSHLCLLLRTHARTHARTYQSLLLIRLVSPSRRVEIDPQRAE